MAGNKRNKNRIVINLDQAAAGQPRSSFGPPGIGRQRRRRWPKVVAIFAIIGILFVMLIAGGGFLWWRNFQTSPAYSLALVIDAAQRSDMEAFKSRLDDEAIAKNLMGTVREKASGRYGISLSDSLQRKIDGVLPGLLPQLKDKIHFEIAKEIKEFPPKVESKPFVVVALNISSFVTIKTEGDTAQVIVPLSHRVIEVSMRRDGDRWKITDFKDDVLVQRIVDGLMKDLPAIGGLDLKIPLTGNQGRSRRRRTNR